MHERGTEPGQACKAGTGGRTAAVDDSAGKTENAANDEEGADHSGRDCAGCAGSIYLYAAEPVRRAARGIQVIRKQGRRFSYVQLSRMRVADGV